jgi:pseudaminic acid cytidylyltransferase
VDDVTRVFQGKRAMRIAIIPARGGSKRIPDKNIVDFFGSPLMSYSIRAAEKSRLFETIHISTDSERIADVAAKWGHPVDFMRPPELANDDTPLLPVLQWTIEEYARRGKSFDSACLLMPTAPLIDGNDLIGGQQLFQMHGEERTVIAVARFSVPIEWAFYLQDDGTLKPCQPGMANVRSQDLPPSYFDAGTFLFVSARDVKNASLNDGRMIAYQLPRHKAVDIDNQEDLELAEILFRGSVGSRHV